MTKIRIALIAICVAVSAKSLTAADPNQVRIMVTVTNLKTMKGELRCALFRSAEGFPRKPEHAALRTVGVIERKIGHCVFPAVPPGPAAITVIHDENNNKKLDMRMGLIPTEGIGWSNNPKVSFGPPSFEQARFAVGTAPATMTIQLNQR